VGRGDVAVDVRALAGMGAQHQAEAQAHVAFVVGAVSLRRAQGDRVPVANQVVPRREHVADGPEGALQAAVVAVAALGGDEPFARARRLCRQRQHRQEPACHKATATAGVAGDRVPRSRRIVLFHWTSRMNGWSRHAFPLVMDNANIDIDRPRARGRRMGKKELAARALATPGIRRLLAAALPGNGVLVLNYHRVGDSSRSRYDRALWSATAEGFDAQVAFLKAECDVIALDDIDDALQRRRGRHVAITFDDGYLDNHDIAFPVLRHHGVPAAFFIATGFIDRRLLPWWDAIAM